MSPVLASPDPLEVYLGFANPIFSTLNDTTSLSSSSNILFPTSSHPTSSLVKRLAHDAAITVAKQSARHKAATLSFVKAYQWIIVGLVGILAIRNIVLIAARNNRKWQLVLQKLDEMHRDKMGEKGMRPLGHRAPMSAKLDAVVFYPFTSKWWLGLENPLQLFLLLATFAINTGFILVCLLPSIRRFVLIWLTNQRLYRRSLSNGMHLKLRFGTRSTLLLFVAVSCRSLNYPLSSLSPAETRSSNS